jgi:hypothetical protein
MGQVAIGFVRSTNPERPIANVAAYERAVDPDLVPQVGDWIQFRHVKLKVESRTWNYVDDIASCLLSIDLMGEGL